MCHEIVLGVIRNQILLDWLIEQITHRNRQRPSLRILLQTAFYQIFILDRIPDHAVVHETVSLARNLGFSRQAGFVNAVLRNSLRNRDQLRNEIESMKKNRAFIVFSHPEWLQQRWKKRFGSESCLELMEWNNRIPPVYVRVNSSDSHKSPLPAAWEKQGIEFKAFDLPWLRDPLFYEIRFNGPIQQQQGFEEGGFYIQDPSASSAVELLNPQKGGSYLDFCAAPGGKTTLIAQWIQNHGEVVACEFSETRLNRLRENVDRMQSSNVEVYLLADWERQHKSSSGGRFDGVLVDVPCSNTGVMRRRIDVRHRLNEEFFSTLPDMQLKILKSAANYVKKGGTLVYSTCSVESEENREVVDRFLKEHSQFEIKAERTILPQVDKMDGAYAAALIHR